jgi:hypothetical protein
MKTLITLMALTAFMAAPAFADGVRDSGVDTRQYNQQVRIREGVKAGDLTRSETHRLREQQRDVRQLERAYNSDGTLTRAERVDLHHEQNQASRSIRRQKHDRQARR